MNELFRHIDYLLLRHECVIVPGLGAFIATVSPARIDIAEGKIIPPFKSVMFNQSVIIDDGLLANSYSRKSGLKFEEARKVVARDVNSVKRLLLDEGEASCGRLGKLIVGTEGNLIFIPHSGFRQMSEALGYSSVNMGKSLQPAYENKQTPEPISRVDDIPPIDDCPADSDKRNYYNLRISKTFLRVASVFVLMVVVALTVILNPIPHDTREQRASVVPVEVLIPQHKQENTVADTIPETPVIPEAIEEDLPSHYLIVATFSSEKEARAYADRYSSSEFPMTTVASRKMCRVAIASSDDRDSLRRQLNSAPISNRYPGAWIWSRN